MSVKRPNNLVSFGCLHPIKIKNSRGEDITVPCRHCAYCRLHHASLVANLGSLEAIETDCILFVTLTYSNENLPTINYQFHNTDLSKSDEFPLYNLQLFSHDGELTDDFITKQNTIDHVQKVSSYYRSRFPQYFNGNNIPVLRISDIRGFIKRINSRCFRKFRERSNFRVLYCGEYGPTTFRPHYHILFYCKSQQVRCFIYNCLYSSLFVKSAWPYGRVNAKYYTGNGCGYLAEYSQGLSTISDVYERSSFKSFCRHSIRFGFQALEKQFTLLGGVSSPSYNEYNYKVDGKSLSLHLPRNFENSVFPRCRDFVRLSPSEQCKRYTIADYYSRKFSLWSLNSPTLLADFIVQQISDFRSLYGYQNPSIESNVICYSDLPYYVKVFGLELIDYDLNRLKSRVYHDCLISFKFLKSYENLPLDLYYSFLDFTRLINRYYENKDSFFQALDAESLALLIRIDDDTATDYFYNGRQISTDVTDYRSSPSFKAWTYYQNARLYDKSKSKKMKDNYTNKPYWLTKSFYNHV